jgi:hypothetical protein
VKSRIKYEVVVEITEVVLGVFWGEYEPRDCFQSLPSLNAECTTRLIASITFFSAHLKTFRGLLCYVANFIRLLIGTSDSEI